MDVPGQDEELGRLTQLRLALFSLWGLYYITGNARKRREEIKLRTWVRIVIVILAGIVMLFLDARPPSKAHSTRQCLFENVGKVVRLALEPALWQSAFANVQGMGERLLHVTHSHLSLFINTDLKPCVNNRIRPFVNGYIKPAVNVLAEHIWRDLHTIIQWTASTESLDSILVSLEGTALHSFGVAVTRWTNGRRADVGRFWTFWTCVLLISFVSVLILILWLLFTQIWRGVARVYAIVIEPKSLIARVWGWVWRIAIVGVIAGISWRIVVVKGEQHFGNIDDL